MNSKGKFNVPHGRYKNPKIADVENLKNASRILSDSILEVEDFNKIPSIIENQEEGAHTTFVYFDPPYRPISSTARFTAYHKTSFSDEKQKELAIVFHKLHALGAKVMLSNSDPRNENPQDIFFETHYNNEAFFINRVPARRLINSKADKRGVINELVITNYPPNYTG